MKANQDPCEAQVPGHSTSGLATGHAGRRRCAGHGLCHSACKDRGPFGSPGPCNKNHSRLGSVLGPSPGPYSRDHSILGSILGPPVFAKPPYGLREGSSLERYWGPFKGSYGLL